ncbi:MAG TPA: Panacea domain-containing protein [Tepidisphaeraceae bacterium]|nr:Panacea domain-containing protein [Tepidisphaeraceae bacterium]
MLQKFDTTKVTQAAAFLLKRHNGFITRIRLLKLLYIADRELIRETHRPLTGDNPVAMDNGPVLTKTYDLLKGQTSGCEFWSRYIQQIAPYTHKLIEDPGIAKLSKIELAKLDEVIQRYWWIDDDELSNITHGFAEWKRNEPPRGGRNFIPTEHVLEALGFGQGDIEKFRHEARAEHELDSLLAGAVA